MFIEFQFADDLCTLRCQGRFEAGDDLDYLESKIAELRSLRPVYLLVDFQQVSSIGSTGLGFLVCAYKIVTGNAGGKFVLAGPNPRVRHILDLTRLSSVIPVAKDVESGLAALGGVCAPKAVARQ